MAAAEVASRKRGRRSMALGRTRGRTLTKLPKAVERRDRLDLLLEQILVELLLRGFWVHLLKLAAGVVLCSWRP